MARTTDPLLEDLIERIKGLEHQAELIKTVLMVKEPSSIAAAEAYEGLRKQVVASAAERRSHLAQLVAMSVAVSRATSVQDLAAMLDEWMAQAGIVRLNQVPEGWSAADLFEDIGGEGLAGPLELVEPAYVEQHTGALLRLGRARCAAPAPEGAEAPVESPV